MPTFTLDWRFGLVLSWLLSSLVLGILASIAINQNVLYDRYLTGSLPAFFLLAARGLRTLQFAKPLMVLALVMTLSSFIPRFAAVYSRYTPVKSEARVMVSDVKEQMQDKDLIFYHGPMGETSF